MKERKRESIRQFLRHVLNSEKFKRNAFEDNQIWIQNSTSIRPINDLSRDYTILLRQMKILKKSQFISGGHFVYPNYKTMNQKAGDCRHEFGIVLKIEDGFKFTEEPFKFFI